MWFWVSRIIVFFREHLQGLYTGTALLRKHILWVLVSNSAITPTKDQRLHRCFIICLGDQGTTKLRKGSLFWRPLHMGFWCAHSFIYYCFPIKYIPNRNVYNIFFLGWILSLLRWINKTSSCSSKCQIAKCKRVETTSNKWITGVELHLISADCRF